MANIPEPVNPGFPAVHQWDIEEDVIGGSDGIATRPIKQLVERTAFLKKSAQEGAAGVGQQFAEVDQHFAEVHQQIDGMKGRGGYLTAHDFGKANPTQQELTDYALAQTGKTDPLEIWNGTHVKNMKNGHVWVLNNTPETEPAIFEWTDDGLDSVGVGDNEGKAGVVSGGLGFDEVFIDENGQMKVKGLKTLMASEVEGYGRNLLTVLGVNTIAEAMLELRRRCNNNNEIDNTGIPDFSGIAIGDYIDGINLNGITAAPAGTAPQAWNDTYKNNRIMVSGFNTYKGAGDTENTKNHILFTFRHVVCEGQINSSDTNANGYPASSMRAWLEGAAGDGSGAFATGLKTALGGNYLYTIKKCHSKKGTYEWKSYSVWLPTEIEVWGRQTYGDELNQYNTNIHFPIYQKSYAYLIKRLNGSRHWWWSSTPTAADATHFCYASSLGDATCRYASNYNGGVAPAFCVA